MVITSTPASKPLPCVPRTDTTLQISSFGRKKLLRLLSDRDNYLDFRAFTPITICEPHEYNIKYAFEKDREMDKTCMALVQHRYVLR